VKDRRRLLSALGGLGASATLPSQWVKPVMETIVLPAHATTTDVQQSIPDNVCPALSAPGRTLNCTDTAAITLDQVFTVIDDQGDCPFLQEVGGLEGGTPPDKVLIRYQGSADNQVTITLAIIDGQSGELQAASAVAGCSGLDLFSLSSKTELLFRASSGATWRVSFALSGVEPPLLNSQLPPSGSVTISEIVFTAV